MTTKNSLAVFAYKIFVPRQEPIKGDLELVWSCMWRWQIEQAIARACSAIGNMSNTLIHRPAHSIDWFYHYIYPRKTMRRLCSILADAMSCVHS